MRLGVSSRNSVARRLLRCKILLTYPLVFSGELFLSGGFLPEFWQSVAWKNFRDMGRFKLTWRRFVRGFEGDDGSGFRIVKGADSGRFSESRCLEETRAPFEL